MNFLKKLTDLIAILIIAFMGCSIDSFDFEDLWIPFLIILIEVSGIMLNHLESEVKQNEKMSTCH